MVIRVKVTKEVVIRLADSKAEINLNGKNDEIAIREAIRAALEAIDDPKLSEDHEMPSD